MAITASLLAAAAFASFDELRVGVLNLMLTVTDTYTGLGIEATFPENVPQAKTDLSYYTLPDIPGGFTPVEIDRRDSQQVFLYVNNKGEKLFISVSFYSSGGNYTLDTENADVVLDVLVSGYRGLYVEKDDVTQVAWLDTDRSVILHVLATGEVGQQVMAMAKQMHYQPAGNTDLMNYDLPAIPEDYHAILTSETERARAFCYENASQDMIVISIYQGSSGTIHAIDTEDADCVLDIVINGYEGLYVEKGDSTQIASLDTDHAVFLDLWAGALPREQVLSMAQELVYKSS